MDFCFSYKTYSNSERIFDKKIINYTSKWYWNALLLYLII